MYDVVVGEEAQIELQDSYDWYENQVQGLGKKFILLMREYINTIRTAPLQYPIIYKEKRAVFIQDFPYQILFSILENKIVIHSVFHTKRNPKIWKNR